MLLSSLVAQASPLSEQQVSQLQGLISQLNPIQQAWVSGYLAASAQLAAQGSVVPAQAAAAASLTILFGSQTGNARHVAEALAKQAQGKGITAKVVDMAEYKTSQLKNEQYLVIVTSTYGEGEPPENAIGLHNFLFSKKAPKLTGLKYAVLGLGDTSYEFFCKTAQDFDSRLTELGAVSVQARADLDVDYQAQADSWSTEVITKLEPELKASAAPSAQVIAWPGSDTTAGSVSQYNKQNPFAAELYTNQKITGRDSTKDVRHIEISLAGSGLSYQPGDALGVYFTNDEALVRELLLLTAIARDTPVTLGAETLTIEQALTEQLELTQSYPAFAEKYAAATGNTALADLAADKTALRAYLNERQIIDIVRDHPGLLSAQQLADALRKQQPRLYSIASSQAEVEDEVHLTVAVVRYDAYGQRHLGGASGFLAERLAEGEKVKVFVEHNNNFRLPQSDDTPVIMIGPGTGIAPFRAFLQERDARGASGKNWLFFGNPHFTQDFLYQLELQSYLKRGVLSKLDVAFSRDQAAKVYVQDKLRKHGAEVWQWLQDGAHLYICGDANRMAKDVQQALIDIVQQYGGKTADEAQHYLDELRVAKRYQKDVY
ncbi:assimilatory sulfite reductase (NADPH) flavoprotein subunit [Rheinheimera aquimaris]|jgi:sulfite reductase (NADPH) flavoprotein alpha-component|uniref:assimilatory sulfite reductase (NADPH) flavoprotein subunit n=1 Tax=Rheinheimera aquimaris TaxID=412437 RepID=UPI000E833780|nr:assimilatory sulfite reductase (NADPH) flavoprotein subunit [Rheinheimera aquimaris]HBN90741.1 assimilatory sulfite reductase (NADPH) flavoprotein subunit [Rheinheimera sp.]